MDLLATSVSLVALVLGAGIGWLLARWRFTTTIAELNTNLVLERRVNGQLRETVDLDAAPSLLQAPPLTTSHELIREPTVVSG
jgi:hypothetical protein